MFIMAHRQFRWCVAVNVDGHWLTSGPFTQYTLVDTGPAFVERVECTYRPSMLVCHTVQQPEGGT